MEDWSNVRAGYADDMDASLSDPAVFNSCGPLGAPEGEKGACAHGCDISGHGGGLWVDQSFFQRALSDGSFLYGVDHRLF